MVRTLPFHAFTNLLCNRHGRVAMAAFVGFCAQSAGLVLPGDVAIGTSFKSCVGATPLDTWDKLPMYGQYQIIAWVGLMEILTEMKKPHYLMGGKAGTAPAPQLRKLPNFVQAEVGPLNLSLSLSLSQRQAVDAEFRIVLGRHSRACV